MTWKSKGRIKFGHIKNLVIVRSSIDNKDNESSDREISYLVVDFGEDGAQVEVRKTRARRMMMGEGGSIPRSDYSSSNAISICPQTDRRRMRMILIERIRMRWSEESRRMSVMMMMMMMVRMRMRMIVLEWRSNCRQRKVQIVHATGVVRLAFALLRRCRVRITLVAVLMLSSAARVVLLMILRVSSDADSRRSGEPRGRR